LHYVYLFVIYHDVSYRIFEIALLGDRFRFVVTVLILTRRGRERACALCIYYVKSQRYYG